MTSTSYYLPELGSPSFTPLLLRYVLSHPSLKGWSINPSLLSVLLLALIVRKGGILIDIASREIDDITKVLQGIVHSIFGLRSHRLALHQDVGPDEINNLLSTWRSFSHGHISTDNNDEKFNQEINEDLDVLIITGLENASSPVKIKLCDILTKKRFKAPMWKQEMNGTDNQQEETNEFCEDKMEIQFDPLVIWVREEGSEVPSWVIDQFMLSIHVDFDDIEIPPPDLEHTKIIPLSYLSPLTRLLPFVHIHAPLQIHISNLFSAVSSHPSLRTTFTGKAFRVLPEYIKAHRILSGDIQIPKSFFNSPEEAIEDKKGLGGGIGGVDTWNQLAGEQPTLIEFINDEDEDELGIEDPYCTPLNVIGIWKVFVTHRCRLREEREEVMYLIKGSASSAYAEDELTQNKNNNVNRKMKGLDRILDEIIRTV
ncbi:uncharacterized protein I206_105790 [Kwoniella pini CBS 10737]|uniref:Uncharacterized protein n=1 Tax=Kwoniella pini CBS 10737 TaxID=1296096 RepID=A0A1B9I059_9TREE|nr:uncharacterized protein I206_04610 [Kwoniella pini CBS 10737]OCF48923.1 hypothetical protein I206_04610 [Kwoniella pini CBS 10737]